MEKETETLDIIEPRIITEELIISYVAKFFDNLTRWQNLERN
ncbi:hypothetical protein [Flavobacterium covae]|nr:hypothetical protein [Flavobacterium covae]